MAPRFVAFTYQCRSSRYRETEFLMRTLYFGAGYVVGILFLTLNAGCEEGLKFPGIRKRGNFLGEIDTSFRPKLDQISLQVRGLIVRPIGPMGEWRQSFDVGDNVIRINNSSISAIAGVDRREKWTNTSKSGTDLRWLNHHLNVGLLQDYRAEQEHPDRRVLEPARLSRIDLETGKWLQDLELDVGVGRKVETVLSALGDQQDLAVLTTSVPMEWLRPKFPPPEHTMSFVFVGMS